MLDPHPKAGAATPRLDAIEQQQQVIHDMLHHLVNGRQTSSEHDPLIHVIAGDEKWNICLSRAGKWLATLASGIVLLTVGAAFTFAFNGAQGMAEVKTELRNINRRLDSMSDYIMVVDSRVNGKEDKK